MFVHTSAPKLTLRVRSSMRGAEVGQIEDRLRSTLDARFALSVNIKRNVVPVGTFDVLLYADDIEDGVRGALNGAGFSVTSAH